MFFGGRNTVSENLQVSTPHLSHPRTLSPPKNKPEMLENIQLFFVNLEVLFRHKILVLPVSTDDGKEASFYAMSIYIA
jgi:hypothetical protein